MRNFLLLNFFLVIFFSQSIIFAQVQNSPNTTTYTLTPGPYTVENLGNLLSINTQDRPCYFKLGNDVHYLLFYLSNYGTKPYQIWDVNLTQGTSRLTDGASVGRIGVRTTVLYPNGKIYLSSTDGNNGYFSEYNPTTGAVREISKTTGSSPGQWSEIGADGWIYVGGFPKAFVDRYNPNTDLYERLPLLDIKNTGSDYAYSLDADTRYLYVGLGRTPWSLSIYDTQTKTVSQYFAGEGDTLGMVRRDSVGKLYYYRRNAAYVMTWYELVNGVPVLTAYTGNNPRPGLSSEGPLRGNVYDGTNSGFLVGYEINLDDAMPNSANNNATIRYRKVGDTVWQSVSMSNFRLEPLGISRLYAWDDTHLMGFSSFYGPVYLWDIATRKTSILGYPQANIYTALIGQGITYLSGYDAITLRYDPSKPWTLTGSTVSKFDTMINPHQIKPTIATHNYYSAFGADGFVYLGVHRDRDIGGGELGWHDPVTKSFGNLRTPFLDYPISDLQPALNGTKMVYVSKKEQIFIFDVATKSIEKTIVPLPGVIMNKVVEVAPGIMFGAAGNNIFKFNITTGEVIYNKILIDKVFQESLPGYRLVLGPDNYVWMFRWYRDTGNANRSSLYRFDPSDGSYEIILADTFYKYGEHQPMFHGADLYFYGSTTLRRIKNILTPIKTNTFVNGDVNNDGDITILDAALLAQYTIGLISLNTNQIAAADVSRDGKISIYDASLIARYVMGLITNFPTSDDDRRLR